MNAKVVLADEKLKDALNRLKDPKTGINREYLPGENQNHDQQNGYPGFI